jgi:hypothetical protein
MPVQGKWYNSEIQDKSGRGVLKDSIHSMSMSMQYQLLALGPLLGDSMPILFAPEQSSDRRAVFRREDLVQ